MNTTTEQSRESFKVLDDISTRLYDLEEQIKGFSQMLDTYVYYDVAQPDDNNNELLLYKLSQPYYFICREAKALSHDIHDIASQLETYVYEYKPAASDNKEV